MCLFTRKSSGTTILICGSLFGQSLLSSRATTQLSRTPLCWRTPPTIQMRYLLRLTTTSSRRCHPRQWTSSKIRKQPAVGTTPPIRYPVVPTGLVTDCLFGTRYPPVEDRLPRRLTFMPLWLIWRVFWRLSRLKFANRDRSRSQYLRILPRNRSPHCAEFTPFLHRERLLSGDSPSKFSKSRGTILRHWSWLHD